MKSLFQEYYIGTQSRVRGGHCGWSGDYFDEECDAEDAGFTIEFRDDSDDGLPEIEVREVWAVKGRGMVETEPEYEHVAYIDQQQRIGYMYFEPYEDVGPKALHNLDRMTYRLHRASNSCHPEREEGGFVEPQNNGVSIYTDNDGELWVSVRADDPYCAGSFKLKDFLQDLRDRSLL